MDLQLTVSSDVLCDKKKFCTFLRKQMPHAISDRNKIGKNVYFDHAIVYSLYFMRLTKDDKLPLLINNWCQNTTFENYSFSKMLFTKLIKKKRDRKKKKRKSRIVLFLYCNTSRTTIILLCTSNWCSFYSSYGNKKFRDIACNAGNYTLHSFTARRHPGTLPLNHIVWCIFVLWVPMEHRAL